MGHELRYVCQVEARRLVWLIGAVFAVVLVMQFFELPYGSVITSRFVAGKPEVPGTGTFSTGDSSADPQILGNSTSVSGSNSTSADTFHSPVNITESSKGEDRGVKKDIVPDKNGGSDDSVDLDVDMDPEDESPSEDIKELRANSPVNKTITDYGLAPENTREPAFSPKNALPPTTPSLALPPVILSPNLNKPTNVGTNSHGYPNTTSMDKGTGNALPKDEISVSGNGSSMTNVPAVKESSEMPTASLVSISEMNYLLLQSRASSFSMKPRWSSAADQDLRNAKLQIANAPIIENNPVLYAPIYWNVSMFKRSYELMEEMLKVYIYKEGDRPIFHTPVLKGIYASEGWFMKLLKANKQFVTKIPNKAHLFYLPFSSRMLEETLYVPDSHSHKNLVQHLKSYLDMIVGRYSFWNRTGGADHFLVACHDWAPSETNQIMAHCIRALCNSDVKEGFRFGKDVSLPETYVHSPQKPPRQLGGKSPSQRQILAFFAGSMHGYLRPILLQHWENKDPDMKIFGVLRNKKGQMNYVQFMKSSKYCICAKGYEVNSPRVVEAIFYECVPVIISDNFVPPFFEILNWESFAVFVPEKDIPNLKNILLSIPQKRYIQMQRNVKKVQNHFLWHTRPVKYDIFHMILHSIWYNRVFRIGPR